MSRILKPLCMILCFAFMAGCGTSTQGHAQTGEVGTSLIEPASEEQSAPEITLTDYQEPPELTVVCGNHQTPGFRSTYSWSYPNPDGSWTGVEADGMHPLEMLEYMTPLSVDPGGNVELQFDLIPDDVVVHCWPEDFALDADDYDLFSEHLNLEKTLKVEDGIVTVPTDGNYVYEVCARWDDGSGLGGSAYYGFWTVADPAETILAVQEPPSTMPMPVSRDPEAIRAYLATLPNDHLALKARQDVVTENAERTEFGQWSLSDAGWANWNSFWDKTQAGEEAAVVMIKFTVEGDAIPVYLHFDGINYYLMEDTTRDAFGAGAYSEFKYEAMEITRSDYGCIVGDHYEKVTTLNVSLTGPILVSEPVLEYPVLDAPEHAEDMGILALQEPTRDETLIREYLNSFPEQVDDLCDMTAVFLNVDGVVSGSSWGEWELFEICCRDDAFHEPMALTIVNSADATVSYISYDGSDYLLVTKTAHDSIESGIMHSLDEVQQLLGEMD